MRSLYVLLLLLALARAGAAQALVPYQHGQLWGYRTGAGRVVIAPRYQHAEPFAGGLAKVWRANKCGYVNAQGREVIPVRWDAASYLEDSISWLSHQLPPWPAARQWVLVMQFDSLLKYPNGHWPAAPWQPGARALPSRYGDKNAQCLGFYTPAGRVVLPARYSSFRALSPQYFAAAIAGERVDAGFFMDGRWRGQLTDFTTELVHRSGRRLALGGRLFHHITALYGDTLVVNGGSSGYNSGYTYEVNWPAELADTTGRRLVWQSAGPQPEQFRTLAPLRGSGGLWLAEYRDRHYSDRLRFCLLRADGTPALGQDIAEVHVLAPGRAVVRTGLRHRPLLSGLLALPSCEWLLLPHFGTMEPVGAQGFIVSQGGFYGAIRPDGRPWLPFRYRLLARCRTQSGHLLPYWYAVLGRRNWLLRANGKKLLALGRHYAGQYLERDFQHVTDDLTLPVTYWNSRPAAVVRLDTSQHRPTATLQRRPRP